jgi:hypothetical protein
MLSPEKLFLLRIDQLRAVLKEPTATNLFDSSAKLRQLLLDEQPLIHQANRRLRTKFVFTVCEPWRLPDEFRDGLVHFQVGDGISPRLSPGPTKELNLDGFLKEFVLEHREHSVSVRDLIKYVAHYAGAVHKGEPDSPQTEALEHAAMTIHTFGMPSVLSSLRGVVDVVEVACDPLYRRLKEQH